MNKTNQKQLLRGKVMRFLLLYFVCVKTEKESELRPITHQDKNWISS